MIRLYLYDRVKLFKLCNRNFKTELAINTKMPNINVRPIIISLLGFFVSAAILTYALAQIGISSVSLTIKDLNFGYCALSFILISLSIIISSLRYGYLNKKFRTGNSWRNIYYVNVISILYSQLAQPLIAQIIGRILHSKNSNPQSLVPITIIEKILSLTVMVLIALIGAYLIFNNLIFGPGFLLSFCILISGAIISTMLIYVILLKASDKNKIKLALIGLTQSGLIVTFFLSAIMHILMILAYVILALQFNPDATFIKLFGAFSLVVLATAVPVGIGGWGIREASTFGVFSFYGMEPSIGVVSSLVLGLLFLFSISLNAFLGKVLASKAKLRLWDSRKYTFDNLWFPGLFFFAIAISFQFKIPTQTSSLNLNLADPLAFLIATCIIIQLYVERSIRDIWRETGVWFAIWCFVLMIFLGWLVGILRFGSNDWATANRLLGLIVIGSYLFSGLGVTRLLSNQQAFIIGQTILFALCLGTIFELFLKPYFNPDGPIGNQVLSYFNWGRNLSGFTGDRNSYAFLVSMVATYLIFLPVQTEKNWRAYFFAALVGTSLWFTFYGGSRTGFGALIVIFSGIIIYKPKINVKSLFVGVVTGIFITNAVPSLTFLFSFSPGEWDNYSHFMGGRSGIADILEIKNERIGTWLSGINMFLRYPIFGGGLGAILESNDLLVHNGPLWILGEMGLVGIILILPLIFVISKRIFKGSSFTFDSSRQCVLILSIIVGGFALTQDILYQRILWFIFGIVMAVELNPKKV